MFNKYSKFLSPVLLASFFLTACDQKPTQEQIDCTKAVSKMSSLEKNKCGKGGDFTKSPEKKW